MCSSPGTPRVSAASSGRGERIHVEDPQTDLTINRGPVLIGDRAGDRDAFRSRRVERADQSRVTGGDRSTTDLSGPRDLVVVWIELLVQDEEPLHTGAGREVLVRLGDVLGDQRVHLIHLRQVRIGGVRQVLTVRPSTYRPAVNRDDGRDIRMVAAERDRLFDKL